MVIFDQLRVSDEGKKIYIDAHVSKAECFANTTIEKLCICLGSQVYETLTIDPESNTCIYSKDYTNDEKEIHEVIDANTQGLIYSKSDFSNDLFFVYIECSGIPEGCSCFAMVGNYFLGVTFDENLLYQRVMDYTKKMTDTCKVPTGFADFILLWNAFKAAIETEHYIPAINYYNMLFGKDSDGNNYGPYGKSSAVGTNSCGCHG